MKKVIFLLLSIVIFSLVNTAIAQDSEVLLYDGTPPGNIENSGVKEEYYNGSDLKRRVRGVTEPKLYYYRCSKKGERPAVIICPGGGYSILSIENEGDVIARWYNDHGFHAFVLKYRLPNDKAQVDKSIAPLMDAQAAIKYVKSHASDYCVEANHVGIMGFSAGGHLAASASNLFKLPVLTGATSEEVRPDFSVLLYPVITFTSPKQHKGSRINLVGKDASDELNSHFSMELQVSPETPTTFILHAKDDNGVPVDNTNLYYDALVKNGVSATRILIEKGGHGFAMKPDSPAYGWQKELYKWMKQLKKSWK